MSILKTISARKLLATKLGSTKWAIPGLIPEGVTLLAGKPKLGKSWIALDLAVAVASGGRALGKIRVDRGRVLLLALEDSDKRIRSRLKLLGRPVNNRLEIAYSLERLDLGGLKTLDQWIRTHQNVRLVIIDTLGRVRPPISNRAAMYLEDTRIGSQLQKLATRHRISILVIHHTRKAGAMDVFDQVSGSTGLTGSVDTIAVLARSRNSSEATLSLTGRDIQEQELTLRFHSSCATWKLAGEAKFTRLSKERKSILRILRKSSIPLLPKQIAEATGLSSQSVRHLVLRLQKEGHVGNNEDHKYFITKDIHTVHTIHSENEYV